VCVSVCKCVCGGGGQLFTTFRHSEIPSPPPNQQRPPRTHTLCAAQHSLTVSVIKSRTGGVKAYLGWEGADG
jgi:hypothetical protein